MPCVHVCLWVEKVTHVHKKVPKYSSICAKTPAVPSSGSTAGSRTLFEELQKLFKDIFDILQKKQLPQGSMKRASSQRFTKLIGN